MKILFVTSSSIQGGAQKHIRDMFISLTKAGHEVYIVAPQGWLLNELSEFKGKYWSFLSYRDGISVLTRKLKQVRPDIINTFILSGGIIGTIAWRRNRYGKLFITVNNSVKYDGISHIKAFLYPRFYKWMSKYASAFLVKSEKVKEEVFSIVKEKKPVLSINNGIDFRIFNKKEQYRNLRKEWGVDQNSFVVTCVGALTEGKGQMHIIEAVAELEKLYPIHLVLVGDGPFRERLEKMVSSYKLVKIVHFLGRRSDINCILANTDIYVLSSYHEGLPNSLMEAMAMGLACIATDVGGVRQLITDSTKGIIVPAKSTEAIEESIETYIKKPSLKLRVGQEAYAYMHSRFDQETVVKELIAIYNKY